MTYVLMEDVGVVTASVDMWYSIPDVKTMNINVNYGFHREVIGGG